MMIEGIGLANSEQQSKQCTGMLFRCQFRKEFALVLEHVRVKLMDARQ